MSKKSGDEHRNLVEQIADVLVTDGFCKSTSHSAEGGIVDAPVPRRKKRAGRSVTQNILMRSFLKMSDRVHKRSAAEHRSEDCGRACTST